MKHDRTALPGGIRSQFAALCWRIKGSDLQVLLITSRDTGRWVIPKGWPMSDLQPEKAAAREAWEEAGVKGIVTPVPLGAFAYNKALSRKHGQEVEVPCVVTVYPLQVDRLAKKYPEVGQRVRKWFSPAKAAQLVDEPELAELIAAFGNET